MIDPTSQLSVSRQVLVLGISRGSVYYKPRPVSDANLKLMHRIDKLHMEFLFAGSRMLQGLLMQEGFKVGRIHVATLMKRMTVAGSGTIPCDLHAAHRDRAFHLRDAQALNADLKRHLHGRPK